MDIAAVIPQLVMNHPAVSSVALTGSRLRGNTTEWSDWDFLVETTNFEAVSAALPALTESLNPLTHLWDPLSRHAVYMMILRGPVKIDLIFDRPQQRKPAWTASDGTLAMINSHFWDWILWIAGKEASGKEGVSVKEFQKMYDYLLAPLGCTRTPGSVEEAVKCYLAAFQKQKSLLHLDISPALETEVIKGLKKMGFELSQYPR